MFCPSGIYGKRAEYFVTLQAEEGTAVAPSLTDDNAADGKTGSTTFINTRQPAHQIFDCTVTVSRLFHFCFYKWNLKL